MSDDLVARLNVVLATLEHGGLLMIAQDDCRWIRDAKAEIERLRAALSDLLRDEQKLDDGDPRLEASRLAARAALKGE